MGDSGLANEEKKISEGFSIDDDCERGRSTSNMCSKPGANSP